MPCGKLRGFLREGLWETSWLVPECGRLCVHTAVRTLWESARITKTNDQVRYHYSTATKALKKTSTRFNLPCDVTVCFCGNADLWRYVFSLLTVCYLGR